MRISWKPGQMLPTFDYTITVLNKLSARDSATKLDVWKATVLHNCSWSGRAERSMDGNNATVGNVFVVRVPKSADYHPYNEWKRSMDGFTFSTGDYIIRGEITEEVTPSTVQSIVNAHKPEAFIIKLFQDNTGTVEALEHYHIEGV